MAIGYVMNYLFHCPPARTVSSLQLIMGQSGNGRSQRAGSFSDFGDQPRIFSLADRSIPVELANRIAEVSLGCCSSHLTAPLDPLDLGYPPRAEHRDPLAVGLENDRLAGAGAVALHGHVVAAFDVLMRLDLQLVSIDALHPVFGVADFHAILGRDRASIHIDARDLSLHPHHVYAERNAGADGGKDEVAGGFHVRPFVHEAHVDGLGERHADLKLTKPFFAEREVAERIARGAVGTSSALHRRVVFLRARRRERSEEQDAQAGASYR